MTWQEVSEYFDRKADFDYELERSHVEIAKNPTRENLEHQMRLMDAYRMFVFEWMRKL